MHPMASLLSTTLNVTTRLAPGLAGRRAFALFVRPLGRARLRPEEVDLMERAERGRMIVYGTAVTTYRWGEGSRPVLVVHGWSSRASRFGGLIATLRAQGRSVISFDAPGHGESEGRASTIRDYRAIIGQLHAEHGDFSAVVAHSFGVLATFSMLYDGMRADRVVGIGGVADFDYLVQRFRAGLNLGEGWVAPCAPMWSAGFSPATPTSGSVSTPAAASRTCGRPSCSSTTWTTT